MYCKFKNGFNGDVIM